MNVTVRIRIREDLSDSVSAWKKIAKLEQGRDLLTSELNLAVETQHESPLQFTPSRDINSNRVLGP